MNALLVDPIPLPSSVAAVPPQLEEITMRALARDPSDRYQSAEELRADLDAFSLSAGGASPAELGALVKVLFATDAPLLLQEAPTPSAGAVAPAVVTRQTAPLRKRGYDRRQLALLVTGAAVAAAMGGGLGWLGKHLGGGVARRAAAAASVPQPMAAASAPAVQPSIVPLPSRPHPSYPSWPASAAAAERPRSKPSDARGTTPSPSATAEAPTSGPVAAPTTAGNVPAGSATIASDEPPAGLSLTATGGDETEQAARDKRAAARRARRMLAKSNPF
jgi:serine/threonine-protein kinase